VLSHFSNASLKILSIFIYGLVIDTPEQPIGVISTQVDWVKRFAVSLS
jgi:hypothetical protein